MNQVGVVLGSLKNKMQVNNEGHPTRGPSIENIAYASL